MRYKIAGSWACLVVLLLSGVPALAGMAPLFAWNQPFANSNSPLGLNLQGINYYSSELPFADLSVMTNVWRTTAVTGSFNSASSSPLAGMTIVIADTGEESAVTIANGVIDSNGNPIALTASGKSFNALSIVLVNALPSPFYPPGSGNSGTYDVYYTAGACNWIYSLNDVTSVSRNVAGGHDVITVSPSASGIEMTVTATGSGASECIKKGVTLSTNTAAYQASNCQSAPTGTGCFNPKFLAYILATRAKTLRFMDWMCTNSNGSPNNTVTATWSSRPNVNTPFYSSNTQPDIACGVPAEMMIVLLNACSCDGWFNIPAAAATSYATGLAGVVKAGISSGLHTYEEYSNETWNSVNGSSAIMQTAGNSAFGCGLNLICALNWYGYHQVQLCAAWKAVITPAACVMGNQVGNYGVVDAELKCVSATSHPCTTGIDGIADAPYFADNDFPTGYTADADGGLNCLFYQVLNTGSCSTGALPTGSGANTTGGTASALTLTSGQSLSGTPANHTCVQGKWGATPNNGATLAVDSVPAAALTDNAGNNVSNAVVSSGNVFVACYTITTSAGSVTASWRVLYNQSVGYSGGYVAQAESSIGNDVSYLAANYPSLIIFGYEGGPSLTNPLGISVLQTMIDNANADTRMATANIDLFTSFNVQGGHTFNYYYDIGVTDQSGDWGLVTSICLPDCTSTQPSSAKLTGYVSYQTANPKAWAFPYLLARDLDPTSNDNAPAFLTKVA